MQVDLTLVPKMFEADDIDALATLRRLHMILHIGFSSLFLEGDSLVVIEEAIGSMELNFSRQRNMILQVGRQKK